MQKQAPRRGRDRGGFRMRLLGRVGGVGFLAAAIAYGTMLGGHLDRAARGTVAGYFGYAAEDIRISGLEWQSPPAVLAAIGVEPGGPLVGFAPAKARRALEDLDWVASARVQRRYPNQLEVHVVERQPFAIWQRNGGFRVIDKAGTVLSGIAADDVPGLPVVIGKGADSAVAQLVNHLEAVPGVGSKMTAAGRIGERRWNLYFTGPVKVLLPEKGLEEALAVLSDLDDRNQVLDRNVAVIDLRVAGAAVLSPPLPVPVEGPVSVAGMSQR